VTVSRRTEDRAAERRDVGAAKPARRRPSAWSPSVLVFSAALAALAIFGYATAVRHADVAHPALSIPWVFFVIAFSLSDNFAVHVEFGDNAHSFNLNELPLVVGLFTCDLRLLVVARVLATVVTLTLFQRQRFAKLVFNISLAALESVMVVGVFDVSSHAIGNRTALLWLIAVAATSSVTVLQAAAITTAVRLSGGHSQPRQMVMTAVLGMVSAAATASLGIATVTMLEADLLAGTVVMAVVSSVLFAAYRGYAVIAQRYANLEKLYGFTKLLAHSPEFETAMRVTLTEACDLLRAERAELCLLESSDVDGAFVSVAFADGEIEVGVGQRFDGDLARARVLEQGRGTFVARHSKEANERRYLAELRALDVAMVPLRNAERVIGTLAVYNRRGEVSTFDSDDIKLFETLANHASVSLENGRLIDQLRKEVAQKQHQALHDPLTELGNRNLLTTRAEEALAERHSWGDHLAVLMLDLNRFKDVNDTLGHQQGDMLLRQVAVRLRQQVPATATVVRLGGDEFAILLPCVSGADEAMATAAELYAAMAQPFVIDGLQLSATAAVGVAVAPEHGEDIAALLQHADIAMYDAKESGEPGVALYDTRKNRHSQRRLTLAAELREAIKNESLHVHYQPKAALADGNVVGAEALLRWQHSVHGAIAPDEFVPLAEGTGLMRDMTLFVLRRALEQIAIWHSLGLDHLHVSVNLSARSLISVELVRDIEEALRHAKVPAHSLTLEITETQMMADRPRTIDVLERLNAVGVGVSIDDFGTGYSSLSYLHNLPVDEIKIDKSFVLTMNSSHANRQIVQSIIDLGRNLGLSVVAEGIEDALTWETLTMLGCDVGQGYFLSRPIPPEHLTPWLFQRLTPLPDAPARTRRLFAANG
jgi:diguanylate cyclase (GGDEF)-like protein